mmetsp:Transcript_63395/g.181918  ORF Transcript_63395/g.181918 Transcript_63395/m.181918 type:complete len:206 (+) Transcript_63395:276-893(+)
MVFDNIVGVAEAAARVANEASRAAASGDRRSQDMAMVPSLASGAAGGESVSSPSRPPVWLWGAEAFVPDVGPWAEPHVEDVYNQTTPNDVLADGLDVAADFTAVGRVRMQCRKTRLCRFFEAEGCRRGGFCEFAHGTAEQTPLPHLRKTGFCKNLKRGTCTFGSACVFAHSRRQLRDTSGEASSNDGHQSHAGRVCRVAVVGRQL